MTQELDLGQSTFEIRDSSLQLHLAAWAQFNQPTNHGISTRGLTTLSNLEGTWITETPNLTFRFFIIGDWDTSEAGTFVSRLRERLCNMEIWSDLGFAAETKMGEHADNTDTPSFHSIELGLRRDHRIHNTIKGWNLPKLMTNPPEVCPPHGVPVATLSSIDVRLEYCLRVAKATTAHLLEERVVQVIPGQIHGETCLKAFGPWPSHISEHRLGLSHEEALQLFELGFQNLVVSRPTKHPSIRTVKQTIEKCLMDLSPAVFNLQYRDGFNQRGVTIPVVTKAISSMLSRSENPSIKATLVDLIPPIHSSHANDPTVQTQLLQLKSAVHCSLWRVAQANVAKPKAVRRKTPRSPISISPTVPTASKETVPTLSRNQSCFDGQGLNPSQMFEAEIARESYEIEESDECLLNSEPESEGQLLGEFGEIGTQDSGDSTQTSLSTLFSTIGSTQVSYNDDDIMMLSSPGSLVDYEGEYMVNYDAHGDMENHDTDIMLDDGS